MVYLKGKSKTSLLMRYFMYLINSNWPEYEKIGCQLRLFAILLASRELAAKPVGKEYKKQKKKGIQKKPGKRQAKTVAKSSFPKYFPSSWLGVVAIEVHRWSVNLPQLNIRKVSDIYIHIHTYIIMAA